MREEMKEILMQQFLEKGVVKFGEFILQGGEKTNIYFDFRLLFAYPDVLELVADILWQEICDLGFYDKFSAVCGVPYASLPLATIISVKKKIPMLLLRQKQKSYGLGKLIEGIYDRQTKCLIVEDVVVTGASVLETFNALKQHGIEVPVVVTVLDREEGGEKNIRATDVNYLYLYTKSEFITQINKNIQPLNDSSHFVQRCFSLTKRLDLLKHPTSHKLAQIILKKLTNLCVFIDRPLCGDFLTIAAAVAPYVCAIQFYCDDLEDFNLNFVDELLTLKNKFNFLIIVSRNFVEDETVSNQFHSARYKISSFADIITAQSMLGESLIGKLASHPFNSPYNCEACLLITKDGDNNDLFRYYHSQTAIKIAEKYNDFIIGFLCHNRIDFSGKFLHFMPNVYLDTNEHSFNQLCLNPQEAIRNGADIVIVGSPICNATDPSLEAKRYQETLKGFYSF